VGKKKRSAELSERRRRPLALKCGIIGPS
jgi:hypothetical protein